MSNDYEPGADGFDYDGEGIQPSGDFTVPEDEYVLRIAKVKPQRSKIKEDGTGNYPQVVVDLVVDEGPRKGFPVSFHYVTFLPKEARAAGMAIHWLKSIGEPWEGKFKVQPGRWLNRTIRAFLEVKEFNGIKNMKIKWVKPHEGNKAPAAAPAQPQGELGDLEEVPF